MARSMKVRTRAGDNGVEVMVLVSHPMETGQRTDKKTKQKIPAHFIQEVLVTHNGKTVAKSQLGVGVSEDPLLGFLLKDAKNGDKVKISWKDNKGESGETETTVGA